MSVVYKYRLSIQRGQVFTVSMPKGAQVLHVGRQTTEIMMWALVDSDQPMEERWFIIIGTGWEITTPVKTMYIGTVMLDGFVWHVFEVDKNGLYG